MNKVVIEKKILSENDQIAARLREALDGAGTLALNLISSPGSGKTLLLEKTLAALSRVYKDIRAAVLTGDIQTDNDARRLGRYGYPVRQITTAGACHLDARMIEKHSFGEPLDLLFIENVGNLVCPTSYDLGEDAKIVVLSVTEGEDKPLKYPGIFRKAELMILNKIDLLPYVPFDPQLALDHARQINPHIEVIETSCTTGAGLDLWLHWIASRAEKKKAIHAEEADHAAV